ncbi:MAG TPA: SUMF1/EgtB/PvdO family nonheme iron enzyme [Terriglobales bacterium]|nr:SUMF1/EgtB/PvdO family nonheme iron enzyme [Terriglobales bacterium]
MAAPSGLELQPVLLERLNDARMRSDELFEIVRPDALYDRPIPERHRIIFYIGHLEAFDWNLLRERVLDISSFYAEFDRLFAFGIDPVGGGLPDDRASDWPSLEHVRGYVNRVRESLDRALPSVLASGRRGEFPLELLLNVAIEHRLMHAETLAYMLHQLPLDRKLRPSPPMALVTGNAARDVASNVSAEIPAGTATLGLSRHDRQFGWDNEYEQHTVRVPRFAIDRCKVTNREYLDFMRAGGYQQQSLWSERDWNWTKQAGITHPVFWGRDGDGWLYRTMFNEIPLPPEWPVYVSHAEASAYARWKGKALPTEAQCHRAAFGTPHGRERAYPWGSQSFSAKCGNFDFASWDPAPVTAFPEGRSAFGVEGLIGNGWEWTSTVFAPFAGFQRFPFYPGYSADFFDGKHYVMKGASARTAVCMVRRSFRNWFQSHYQYVYAGFRCVEN